MISTVLAPKRRRGCCWPAAQPRASSPLSAGQYFLQANHTETSDGTEFLKSSVGPASCVLRRRRRSRHRRLRPTVVVVGSVVVSPFPVSTSSVSLLQSPTVSPLHRAAFWRFSEKGRVSERQTDGHTELASLYHPNSTHHPQWRVRCNVGRCPGGQ